MKGSDCMKPLAYRMRPQSFDEIYGQDFLVGPEGIIRKMIDNDCLSSMILYGDPGCGKTSIAMIIAANYSLNNYFFNASIDSKDKLKEISEATKYYDNTVLIIDEIHRMKKDIQDYLLSFMESGKFIIIGLTTSNPYHSINPAIRSRCHLFKLNPINNVDMRKIIDNALSSNEMPKKITLDEDVYSYIINNSNQEVRTALNTLEILAMACVDCHITLELAQKIILKPSMSMDRDGDGFYDTISALQKSIRGSDTNASLHYLARLLASGDLEIITRRLLVIAFGDIGLANPSMGERALAACTAAQMLGLPEARIPLSQLVIDMSISPKSNSSEEAIDKALTDVMAGKGNSIPDHLKNGLINAKKATYKYPHDYKSGIVSQQYLPDDLIGVNYYTPKETGSYERALKERYEVLKTYQIKKKHDF